MLDSGVVFEWPVKRADYEENRVVKSKLVANGRLKIGAKCGCRLRGDIDCADAQVRRLLVEGVGCVFYDAVSERERGREREREV